MGQINIGVSGTSLNSILDLPWDKTKATLVMKELALSGLSVAAFAERHGLKPYHLYRWRGKLKADSGSSDSPKVLPVRLVNKPAEPQQRKTSRIDVVTPQGFVVKIRGDVDVQQLQRALRAIGGV
jgi:transposase-like protein